MNNALMIGLWRYMIKVPPRLWEKRRTRMKEKMLRNLGFLTGEHRLVHHFVVRELPIAGKPLAPEAISLALHLSPERTAAILADLEAHMTFLFRNARGEVVWAYPVTVEPTPHHVTFHTGEAIYAAWAADAFATPFVQGQLRKEPLSVVIRTACAHCGRPMELTIDQDLNWRSPEKECRPIAFVPDVDLFGLEEDSIINAF